MSVYLVLDGIIKYRRPDRFGRVKQLLEKRGYTDSEHKLLYTDGWLSGVLTKSTIVFPNAPYRNIGEILEDILIGSTGWIMWYCVDGSHALGFIVDGEEVESASFDSYAKAMKPLDADKMPEIIRSRWDRCEKLVRFVREAAGMKDGEFPTYEQIADLLESVELSGKYRCLDQDWEDAVIDHFKCNIYTKYYDDVIKPTIRAYEKGYALWRRYCDKMREKAKEKDKA